ncbi:TrkH family potassium uptake protein [Oceanicoccus sagamiensis]|uniref:Trk system potassium uptake protein n=1 Tax=Oceanicoccus sagamiensis TaxID=716816 RepID=A0A1X9NAF9_9GAMM|nr:TrkH family potassium uptake protein [Oceanicoccus sagamiensis]ARN74044.1 potassium transporter [Oceanicoccus sagamiensis]
MHIALIFRILGMLLMVFSLTLFTPIAVSLWYDDGVYPSFLLAFAITVISGALMWMPVAKQKADLRTRDGFLITSLFWTVLGLFGALPFILAPNPELTISDAVFESLSGLTTTGATVITGLDHLPKSILFYRQQLQWLGGIGIIVIAVAILPMLGIGGMQLYRAETPGPVKDSKLTPRIAETAKALFLVYVLLTATCAVAYWAAGMSGFDAICHAFSTIAIGGFSTHDASIGYFNSPAIMLIACLYMMIAGVNFALHFHALRQSSYQHYVHDSESRFFAYTIFGAAVIVATYLILSSTYSIDEGLLHGLFQTISIATTAGFATADFSAWPSFLPFMLIMLSFMGGCGGSTGGGMKAVRVMLMAKQGVRELSQLVHPNAVIPLKVGNRRVEAKVVSAVWSFFAVYMFAFIIILFLLMATGLDYVTAFSAVVASMNNLGPGLGEVASNYGSISAPAKWILCFSMLLGRLEVFTLLVLFTPAFWRQ